MRGPLQRRWLLLLAETFELMVAVRPTFHTPALLAKQAAKSSIKSATGEFR